MIRTELLAMREWTVTHCTRCRVGSGHRLYTITHQCLRSLIKFSNSHLNGPLVRLTTNCTRARAARRLRNRLGSGGRTRALVPGADGAILVLVDSHRLGDIVRLAGFERSGVVVAGLVPVASLGRENVSSPFS